MSDLEKKIEILKHHVSEFPDFPKPGILFRDMFSIFVNPEVTSILRDILVALTKEITPPVECIVALDARGFLLGPLIALELKIPLVPVRKKGKLPGEVISTSYSLEYGKDTLEIQKTGIKKGQKVLVVDDLLATGSSLGAACQLIRQLEGEVVGCLVLMELTALKGRDKVPADIISVLKY